VRFHDPETNFNFSCGRKKKIKSSKRRTTVKNEELINGNSFFTKRGSHSMQKSRGSQTTRSHTRKKTEPRQYIKEKFLNFMEIMILHESNGVRMKREGIFQEWQRVLIVFSYPRSEFSPILLSL
jgi:hypothetical protein